jgi:tetratricopeptide (TPR) repeat protein
MILLSVQLAHASALPYAGSEACRDCHPREYELQSGSAHARALSRATPGSPGQWAFGAGMKAITYVSRIDDETYVEQGLTYYPATRSFGPTPGHKTSSDLRYPTFEPGASIPRCFRCHSTGQPVLGPGFSIQPEENGVRCEACHGPGAEHVKASGAPNAIRNPKRLNAIELNELCGSCHRKPPEPGEGGDRVGVGLQFDWSNAWNTRHQPVYLSQSACFRASGGGLSCLTCHDPHGPLSRSAGAYDARCMECHRNLRHTTDTGSASCTACHMPKVQASPELAFTNHWIGIYASGEVRLPAVGRGRNLPPLSLPASPEGKLLAPNDPSTLRPLFEQALAHREKQFGRTHVKVARDASNLGFFLKEIGRPGEAVTPLRRALEINRRLGGVEAGRTEERLAEILELTGNRTEALDSYRRAAAGADPRVSARSYARLAKLEPEQAESYYRRAVRAEEAASGADHPRVAALLSNLALAVETRQDNRTAETLLRRALKIQDSALGRDHYQTATTLSNLGSLLYREQRLEEAGLLQGEALRIFEQTRPHSAELAAAYTNLGAVLAARGDNVGAAALLWKGIAVDEAVYGMQHPDVAAGLTNLALLLRNHGEAVAAESLLKRALSIYEEKLGAASSEARAIRDLLAAGR